MAAAILAAGLAASCCAVTFFYSFSLEGRWNTTRSQRRMPTQRCVGTGRLEARRYKWPLIGLVFMGNVVAVRLLRSRQARLVAERLVGLGLLGFGLKLAINRR